MAQQRTPGKAWTNSEDECLVEAVNKYGENTDSWKTIAEAVPGRTNKACRKRWKHSLHPSIKKTPWEPEEDELLVKLYAQHPGRWALIANNITGRTDDACAKRYREALDPNLKKDDWTKEEDERLLEGFGRHGASWGKIGEELGRSGLGCRNRWRLLERRKNALERRKSKPTSAQRSRPAKLKQAVAEDPTTDEEASEDDEMSRPRPSRRRSNTFRDSKLIPLDENTPQPSAGSRSGSSETAHLSSGHSRSHSTPETTSTIDPSIIGMALGKCPCGCASGISPCNCTSTYPTLSLPADSHFIDSLDWTQLFPYLHAELPTVFVEPPPIPGIASPDQAATFNAYQGASVLQEIARNQFQRCNCSASGGGCCSTESASEPKSSCCSTQPATRSCCQPKNSDSPSRDNLSQSNQINSQSDAEAAKLLLDYASFLLQRQQEPPQTMATLQQPLASSNFSANQNPPPPASCQTPASHLLIGIIEKYQQQKSAPSSNTASGLLSSIPLPDGSAGCGCGCGPSSVKAAEGASPTYPDAVSNQPALPTEPNAPSISAAIMESSTLGTTMKLGGCCGGGSGASNMVAPPPDVPTQFNPSSTSTALPYFPALEPQAMPTLPSYIPGCTCGCASGAPAGTCSCGCVGICLCGSGLQMPPSTTVPETITFLSNNDVSSAEAPRKSCCGGGSKGNGATVAPDHNVPMDIDIPKDEYTSIEGATLPSFIPGCECGCAAGMDAGACSCGCIGICSCGENLMQNTATKVNAAEQSTLGLDQPEESIQDVSPHSHNQSVEMSLGSCCSSKAPKPTTSTPKLSNTMTNPRLSAQNPAPLPAYACGHPDCWMPGSLLQQNMHEYASAAFHTSAELAEHRRAVHGAEEEEITGCGRGTGPSGSWLFRCGLVGCEKGWKSINGIQYHLQLSKVHFVGLLKETAGDDQQRGKSNTPGTGDEISPDSIPAKAFKCPREGCTNSYKQAAGLKYHLAHGHPIVQPIQFGSL